MQLVPHKNTGQIKVYGRIKIGASIGHDHAFFRWPNCLPPKAEFDDDEEYQYLTKYPDRIFILVFRPEHNHVACYADGYGATKSNEFLPVGNYGNGAIHTYKPYVEIVYREVTHKTPVLKKWRSSSWPVVTAKKQTQSLIQPVIAADSIRIPEGFPG